MGPSAPTSTPQADTSIIFDSFAPSASASAPDGALPTASITGLAGTSAAASTTVGSDGTVSGPTKIGSGTVKQTGSSKTTKAPHTTSIDPRLPAGGVQMLTPAAIAQASYYKIGDQITFGWNYTSLVVTPTAVDILAYCSANQATYTIATNTSVKATGIAVWDTENDASGTSPLLTETYTLIIHDAGQPVTAVAQAGYLGTYDSFTFGMYVPQPYTPLNDFVCATCSGALSDLERQTLKFLFGTGFLTILSFTWFAGGCGVFS
ncbi:hypothetical protein MMC19_004869 [Ptychographa xylographoides]|nr:hypothetical protein [Ptychographa xylographoides]